MSVREATGDDLPADGGPPLYEIALDGRALRTPSRQPMRFASYNLVSVGGVSVGDESTRPYL